MATAYLIRSLDLTAAAAEILGFQRDQETYTHRAEESRQAFVSAYVNTDATMSSDAQTAYALALCFAIVEDPEIRSAMALRLADLVQENGYRIGTGFVGTPLVAKALSDNGYLETAAKLLLETSCPSWLYPVTVGATTIWERWDSLLPDGSVNPGSMTSFNHYALGSIADWMHRDIVGISPREPGFRRIAVAPKPIDGVNEASGRLESPYGQIAVWWRKSGQLIEVGVTIPPNTEAEVLLPGADRAIVVGSGTRQWAVDALD